MIALARKVPAANATMHAGKWEKKNLQGSELRAKMLGILGLGRVGLEVAKRARAFGMEIVGTDPFVSAALLARMESRSSPLRNYSQNPTTSRCTWALRRRRMESSTRELSPR
ncbi:MAG: NAD(P)-dependent oxidoreductase [Terracidiphilus sp.]